MNLMKIIMVGVSYVGKLLADKLGYKFFDFDFEIEKHFNSHITFLKKEFPSDLSYKENASGVLNNILKENNDNYL